MARIQFPTNKLTGTEHTHGNRKYRFDGKRWKKVNTAAENTEANISAAFNQKQAEIDSAKAAMEADINTKKAAMEADIAAKKAAMEADINTKKAQLDSTVNTMNSTVNTMNTTVNNNASAISSLQSSIASFSGDPSKPVHSGSDFANGTLVTTNIPASATNGASFIIEVTGKSYSTDAPFNFMAQGYLYNNTIINYSGSRQGKNNLTYIIAMNNNGYLSFWWPRVSYWNSFQVTVRNANGSIDNTVTNISNSADPTSASKRVTIQLNGNSKGPTGCTVFTSSGTWTKPAWCTRAVVEVVGGGGGASGYSESGGAGGYACEIINNPASSVGVTVGGGGGSTQYYAAAGNGGTSSFGSYCSASGGYGANRHYGHSGGHGGVGSGGHVNILGGGGTGHTNSNASGSPAKGGGSYMGGGTGDDRTRTNSKVHYGAPGAGGPGSRGDTGWRGAPGETGIVIVWEYA